MPEATAKYRIEATDATGAGIRSALKNVNDFGENARNVLKTVFAGIAVGEVVSGLTRIATTGLEVGDNLSKAADKAGVSGEAISQLAYAAKLANVDLDALSKSLGVMERNLSEAATGGKTQNEALAALGLTFRDLKGLAPDKQFELIGNQISRLKDPSDRARAAMELFSKSGADLLPLFSEGAKGIREAREEAVKFGQSFSTAQLKELADAHDVVDKLTSSFEALAVTLASKVAPAFNEGFKAITGLIGNDSIGKLAGQLAVLQKTDSFYGRLPGLISSAAGLGSMGGLTTHGGRQTNIQGLQSLLDAMRSSQGFGGTDQFAPSPAPPGYVPQGNAYLPSDFADKAWQKSLQLIDPKMLEDARGNYEGFFKDIEGTTDAGMEKISKVIEDSMKDWSIGAEVFDDSMKHAFDNLIETGEFSFRELALDFVKELSRAEIFKAIDKISAALDEAFQPAGKASDSVWGVVLKGLGGILGSGLSSAWGSGAAANAALADQGFGANFHVQDIPIAPWQPRAVGGPVSAGSSYLVGEKGPEMFLPSHSGTIVPNNKLGGGDVNVVYNVSGLGLNEQQVSRMLERNTQQIGRQIQEQRRRGAFQ